MDKRLKWVYCFYSVCMGLGSGYSGGVDYGIGVAIGGLAAILLFPVLHNSVGKWLGGSSNG